MILFALLRLALLEKSDAWGPDGAILFAPRTVVSGLEVPGASPSFPAADVLVSERPGRVRLLQGGKLVARPCSR